MQFCDPLTENVPSGHLVHAPAPLAPEVCEYVPPGQSVHTLAPVTLEYLPAEQLVHLLAPDTFEYVPAVQFSQLLTPVTPEYVPTGQLLHTLALKVSEYVPATHCTQLPSCRFQPARHPQTDVSSETSEPSGHGLYSHEMYSVGNALRYTRVSSKYIDLLVCDTYSYLFPISNCNSGLS